MNDDLFSKTPRGIRNNNWLNIKFNPCNHWKGQIGNDGTFCIFFQPVYGIRAAYKILKSYLKRNKDLNLEQFIYQWSTTDRNDYLSFIVRNSSALSPFLPCTTLSSCSTLDIEHLFFLMALFENGLAYRDTFDKDVFIRGIYLK